jgi:Mitochondrial carrier protein
LISDRPAKNYENTIMGGLASAATVCIMIPMDTIKTRLVTQSSRVGVVGTPYKGIIDCGMRIAKEEGVKTFYRGLAPRLISVVPLIAVQFSIYEAMKRTLIQRHHLTSIPPDEYGPEEVVEEAAMEASASGSNASPAPRFHKKVPDSEQKTWRSLLGGK